MSLTKTHREQTDTPIPLFVVYFLSVRKFKIGVPSDYPTNLYRLDSLALSVNQSRRRKAPNLKSSKRKMNYVGLT